MTAQIKKTLFLKVGCHLIPMDWINFQYVVVQLDLGLKLDTTIGLYTTHHPPQTFRALLGMVGGGDLSHNHKTIQGVMVGQSPSLRRSPSNYNFFYHTTFRALLGMVGG